VGFLLYFTTLLLSIRCRLAAIVKGGGKRGRNGGGTQTGKTADTRVAQVYHLKKKRRILKLRIFC